ncbi:MAG: ribosome biogenesis/translation initiation ATPase RLI [Candidatus Hermodarchaeota archaeon]|nr:ribosome biogenesis/translation initiation ATPase RLI [Candidatus Hermodarchaeota archaeon]
MRIAVLDPRACNPAKCSRECQRFCPPQRMGDEVVIFDKNVKDSQPRVVELLCTGCGICTRKCPFGALRIINLADELDTDTSHRYGPNSFKLFRLPIPAPGAVTGLVGANGTGKSTALKILATQLQPNLGNFDDPPDWAEIIRHYRGSGLQPYFEQASQGDLTVAYKPQNVTAIPEAYHGSVQQLLESTGDSGKITELTKQLELQSILQRDVSVLSGGELQRVAIAAVMARDVDVYLIDEPTSYLDVYQRVRTARAIRSLAQEGKMVISVVHDLAVADYISDYVCIFYGTPGVYGIVSNPHGVREGINIYLNGYLPDSNVRFRNEEIRFETRPPTPEFWTTVELLLEYEAMVKRFEGFTLQVMPGQVHQGEVIGVLGPNGIGKTTFVRLLAQDLEPDEGNLPETDIKVSYKPQYLSSESNETLIEVLQDAGGATVLTSLFKSEVLRPLSLDTLEDRIISELSGGELQRVAIAACLARPADLYLLDEPSAFLDIEQRLATANVIRSIVHGQGKAAFVVEHDMVALSAFADTISVFSGMPGNEGLCQAPIDLRNGMNIFLSAMGVTFRRDHATGRPRVNKEDSRLDREQKQRGEYYYISTETE